MKKPAVLILAVLVVAAAAYVFCYRIATRETRQMMAEDAGDGIAWLRREFALNEEQTQAITTLQKDYEPRCLEMCARIVAVNRRIEKLLPASPVMTPELKAELDEAGRVQAECREATLSQALAVSANMAPEHALRYRTMVAAQVLPGAFHHNPATHR